MKSLLAFIGVAFLILGTGAVYQGTLDTTGLYDGVGMVFLPNTFALYQSYQCDASVAPSFFSSCTNFLLDSDQLLTDLNTFSGATVFTAAHKNTLRRRLVATPAHCTRLSNGGGDEFYPIDSPIAPGYIGFKYNIIRTPGVITPTTLGYQPCAVPTPSNGTILGFTSVKDFPIFKYKTLAVAEIIPDGTGIGKYKNDFAFFIIDEAVPSRVVSDGELIRVAITNYEGLKLSSVVSAGFGMAYYGNTILEGNDPHGKPDPVGGRRERQYGSLPVNSVQNSNIVASMVISDDEAFILCSGDSGSPALKSIGDRWYAYGSTTAGDANCRSTNTFTRIGTPHYLDWAKRSLLAYFSAPGGNLNASQRIRAGDLNDFLNVKVSAASSSSSSGEGELNANTIISEEPATVTWSMIVLWILAVVGVILASISLYLVCRKGKHGTKYSKV